MTSTLFGQATETVDGPGSTGGGSIGVEFSVSQQCTLNALWLYSPSGQGLTALPPTIALYTVTGQALVVSQAASWSGAAGSGWVRAAFSSPPVLTASVNYTAVAFDGSGTAVWFAYNSSGWPSNITSGPLSAVAANQGIYTATATGVSYPASQLSGYNWYLDAEVSPATVTATGAVTLGLAAAASGTEAIPASGAVTLPLQAAGSVTVANPVTATGAVTLGLASGGTVLVPAPVSGAGAVTLGLAPGGSLLAANPVSASGVVSLGLRTGGSAGPPVWPGYYTVNFCPNPSAEAGVTGYSQVTGGEQVARGAAAWAGSYGVSVRTPGLVPGEGVITPPGQVLTSVTGSASAYVYGDTGYLTVSAVQSPGGQVLGSAPVQPAPGAWQRVVLDGLAMTAGTEVFLVISTATAQALSFTVDAVQYEPESPAHPYTDGSLPYGAWEGGSGSSPSFQQYASPASAAGGMVLDGAVSVTAHGSVFRTAVTAGQMDASGQPFPMCAVSSPGRAVISPAVDPGVTGMPWEISGGGTLTGAVVLSPGSGMGAFAVFSSADPDPAMTLIGASNAGALNASRTATAYTRSYGAFTPPRQALDSAGNALWQGAAYMAAGFAVASQAAWSSGAPDAVNFTQVQAEKGSAPTGYQRPRSLSTVVRPTRVNYVANPSLEVSAAGWTAFGGASLARAAGGAQGSWCLQVTVPAPGGGAYITVPLLITGDAFTASAYVSAVTANIADVTLAAGGASASANPTGFPFGGAGYGTGPYGGVNAAAAPMATGTWAYRPWAAFTAPASSVTLSLSPVAVTGAAYPLVFSVDGAMVTPGEALLPYGDGASDGWQWEAGGTPGLSRGYYYERQGPASAAVQSVLSQHVPLGLTAGPPQYAVPPAQ